MEQAEGKANPIDPQNSGRKWESVFLDGGVMIVDTHDQPPRNNNNQILVMTEIY